MDKTRLSLCCPYCEHTFEIEAPILAEKWLKLGCLTTPSEVECLPYTRDIGRFDPKNEQDWLSAKGWSRLGPDFMRLIQYQRIGILRVLDAETVIMYRVQGCSKCKNLFDVYANYTRERRFVDLWPHVFGTAPGDANEIHPYWGLSWPLWLVRKLGGWLGSNPLGCIAVGLTLFLLRYLLWLLPGRPQAIPTLLAYGIACLGITAILILTENYVRYLETTPDFQKLFLARRKRGVTYWRNFTLSRIVGVQTPGRLPRPSQVDIITGGLSTLSILLAWLFLSLPGWQSTGWEAGQRIIDLLFWMAAAYFLGSGALLTKNQSIYVLKGIRKIPLSLSPLNDFEDLQPLRKIQASSTWTILTLFFTALGLVSLLVISTNPSLPPDIVSVAHQMLWLEVWLVLGLAIIFAALGIGGKMRSYLIVVSFYVILQAYILFSPSLGAPISLGENSDFKFSPQVLVLGIFMCYLLVDHILAINHILKELVEKARSKFLDETDEQIQAIINRTGFLTNSPGSNPDPARHLCEQPSEIQALETLLRLRETIKQAGPKPRFQLIELGSLVLWSLILPSVWNYALGKFFNLES